MKTLIVSDGTDASPFKSLTIFGWIEVLKKWDAKNNKERKRLDVYGRMSNTDYYIRLTDAQIRELSSTYEAAHVQSFIPEDMYVDMGGIVHFERFEDKLEAKQIFHMSARAEEDTAVLIDVMKDHAEDEVNLLFHRGMTHRLVEVAEDADVVTVRTKDGKYHVVSALVLD